MAPARGYKWNNRREELYLVLLRDIITNGQRVENGWKPEFWTNYITAFRDKGFPPISRQQLKNKKDAVYKIYYISGPTNDS
jgi:hypothetical protein